MDGNIAIGTMTLPINTAFKASVIALLTSIAGFLAYIIYWLTG